MAYPLKLATRQNIESQGQDIKFFVELDWLKNNWEYVIDSYDMWMQFRELIEYHSDSVDEATALSITVNGTITGDHTGRYMYISSGNASGQVRLISSNTSSIISLCSPLDTVPAANSVIKIITIVGMSADIGKVAAGSGVTGSYGVSALSDNEGTGTVDNIEFTLAGQGDIWTLVCIGRSDIQGVDRARFLVRGKVFGLKGDAYSGEFYSNNFISFVINEGNVLFQEGDTLTVRPALVTKNNEAATVLSGLSTISAPLIDGGPDFLRWNTINWEGENVEVYVRTSTGHESKLWSLWKQVYNGEVMTGVQDGRYIQVKLKFGSSTPQGKIYNLKISYKVKAHTNFIEHNQYVPNFNRIKDIRASRNKSEDLQGYSAADFNITWDNSARLFSRENVSSPYYGYLEPNIGLSIAIGFEEELIPRVYGTLDGFSLSANAQTVTTRGKDKVKQFIKTKIKLGNASYRAWTGQSLKFMFKILALDAGFSLDKLDMFDLVVNPLIDFVDFRDKSVWTVMQELAIGNLADVYVTEEGKLKLVDQFSPKHQIASPSFFEGGADYLGIVVNSFYNQLIFIVGDSQATVLYSYINADVLAVTKDAIGAVYVNEDDFEEGKERHNIWFTSSNILYRLLGSDTSTEFEEIVNASQHITDLNFTNMLVYNSTIAALMGGPALLANEYGRSVFTLVLEDTYLRIMKLNNADLSAVSDIAKAGDLEDTVETAVNPFDEDINRIKNGEFDNDAYWDVGAYWAISGGVAEFNTAEAGGTSILDYSLPFDTIDPLKEYTVRFKINEMTSGVSLKLEVFGDEKTYTDEAFTTINEDFPVDIKTKALLHFDEGIDDIKDSSVYGNVLTANGNADTVTSQKVFGLRSLSLPNSTSNISTPDNNAFTLADEDFTVEARIRLNSIKTGASTFHHIVTSWYQSGSNYKGWLLTYHGDNDTLMFYFSKGPTFIDYKGSSVLGLVVDQWYHVVVVREGTTLRFFVDGVAKGTGTIGTDAITSAEQDLMIGGVVIGGGLFTGYSFNDGYIDEVRIVKGEAKYTTPFTSPILQYNDNSLRFTGNDLAPGGSDRVVIDNISIREKNWTNTDETPLLFRNSKVDLGRTVKSERECNVYYIDSQSGLSHKLQHDDTFVAADFFRVPSGSAPLYDDYFGVPHRISHPLNDHNPGYTYDPDSNLSSWRFKDPLLKNEIVINYNLLKHVDDYYELKYTTSMPLRKIYDLNYRDDPRFYRKRNISGLNGKVFILDSAGAQFVANAQEGVEVTGTRGGFGIINEYKGFNPPNYNIHRLYVTNISGVFQPGDTVTVGGETSTVVGIYNTDITNDIYFNRIMTVYEEKDSVYNGHVFYLDTYESPWGSASIVVRSTSPDFADTAPPAGFFCGIDDEKGGAFVIPNSAIVPVASTPEVTITRDVHKVLSIVAVPSNQTIVILCECFKTVATHPTTIYSYDEFIYKIIWFKIDHPYSNYNDIEGGSHKDSFGNVVYGEEVLDLVDSRIRLYDGIYNSVYKHCILCGGYNDDISNYGRIYKWGVSTAVAEFSNLAGKPIDDVYLKEDTDPETVTSKEYFFYFQKIGGYRAVTSEIWAWTDYSRDETDRERCVLRQDTITPEGSTDGINRLFTVPVANIPFKVKHVYIDGDDIGDSFTFDGEQIVIDTAPAHGAVIVAGGPKRLYRHYGIFLSFDLSNDIGSWAAFNPTSHPYKPCKIRITLRNCQDGSITMRGYDEKQVFFIEVITFTGASPVDENGDKYEESTKLYGAFDVITQSDASGVYVDSDSRMQVESIYFDLIPGVYIDVYTTINDYEDQFGGNGTILGYVDKAAIKITKSGGLVALDKITSENRMVTMSVNAITGSVYLGTENRGYGVKYDVNQTDPLPIYRLEYDKNITDLSYDWNDNDIKNAIVVKTKKMQVEPYKDIDNLETGLDVSGSVPSADFLSDGRTYDDWVWARLHRIWLSKSPKYLHKGQALEYEINFQDPVDNSGQDNTIKFDAQYSENIGHLDEDGNFRDSVDALECDFPDHKVSDTLFALHAGYGELHDINTTSKYYRIFAPWDGDDHIMAAEYPSRNNAVAGFPLGDFTRPELESENVLNGKFLDLSDSWVFDVGYEFNVGEAKYRSLNATSGSLSQEFETDLPVAIYLLLLTADTFLTNTELKCYAVQDDGIGGTVDVLLATIIYPASNATVQFASTGPMRGIKFTVSEEAGGPSGEIGVSIRKVSLKEVVGGNTGKAAFVDLTGGIDLSLGGADIILSIDGGADIIIDCAALATDIEKVTAQDIVNAINQTVGQPVAIIEKVYIGTEPSIVVKLNSLADVTAAGPVTSTIKIYETYAASQIFGIPVGSVSHTVDKVTTSKGLLEKKGLVLYAGEENVPLSYDSGDFDIVANNEDTATERWCLQLTAEVRTKHASDKLVLWYPNRINVIRSDIDKEYRDSDGSVYNLVYGISTNIVIRQLRSYTPQLHLYVPAIDEGSLLDPAFVKGLSGFHLNMIFPNDETLLGSSLLRIENPTNEITDSLYNPTEDPSNLSVWINKIEIRGLPIVANDIDLISVKDEKSIQLYTKIEDTFSNDYIQDVDAAKKLGNYRLSLKSFPRILPSVKIVGLPFLQLGDIVAVKEINSALAYDLFEILSISESIGVDSAYLMDITLFKVLDVFAGSYVGRGLKYNTGIAYKDTSLTVDYKEDL